MSLKLDIANVDEEDTVERGSVHRASLPRSKLRTQDDDDDSEEEINTIDTISAEGLNLVPTKLLCNLLGAGGNRCHFQT